MLLILVLWKWPFQLCRCIFIDILIVHREKKDVCLFKIRSSTLSCDVMEMEQKRKVTLNSRQEDNLQSLFGIALIFKRWNADDASFLSLYL